MSLLGRNLEILSIQKGMNNVELAEKSKVALTTINNILSNRVTPRISTIEKLANALDITVSKLLSEDLYKGKERLSIENVGRNLEKICSQRKISHAELARKSGVTTKTMYNTINSVARPRITIVNLWADALDITPEVLMKNPET